MTKDILVRYYSNVLLAIRCAYVAGRPVLAKPALLIGTIDAIDKQKVNQNKLFYDALKESYSEVCMEFRIKETSMSYPFYFMASENFWNLQWNCSPIKTKSPSEKMLHEKVDYAYLDNALWDLLQDVECRERLREAIVKHFFDETKEQELPMAAEASIAYGDDEATPRQLNYIKRVTGNDYRGQGLTKRQASKMIRELIDDDEGKKVAEPAFKPGSLEEILSKCSTREEQLEAARKFFGENK